MVMNIAALMEKRVATCTLETNLEDVAKMMWDNDCGSIPVVDDSGKPVGMITDRDIAMGASINHKPLWELRTREITNSRELFTCSIEDDIHHVLDIMKDKKVRRLPVVNSSNQLLGIVSMGDLVFTAEKSARSKKSALSFEDVLHTLKSLYGSNTRYSVGT